MAKNIVEAPEQEARWISKYNGLFTAEDLVKHYFNILKKTLDNMIYENNRGVVFYTPNGPDEQGFENVSKMKELVYEIEPSEEGLRKIGQRMKKHVEKYDDGKV